MIQKYNLEFILYAHLGSVGTIKSSLTEFGDNLEVVNCEGDSEKGKNFKVSIKTEDPTMVFDICSQFGRIKSVKVNEIKP
jgi:dihydroxyacetone kinase-like predicted kinase